MSTPLASPSFTGPKHQSSILIGPLGLRAGWGILMYLLVSLLLGTALFLGLFKATGRLQEYQREGQETQRQAERARAEHRPAASPVVHLGPTFLSEAAESGAVLLAAWGLSFVERRRFGVYGLGARRLRDIVPGAATGLLAMVLLIGLLRASHSLLFEGRLLDARTALQFGLGWLLTFLLVGVFEEFLFRGYLQFTLMRGLLGLGGRISPERAQTAAFWMAAVLWSFLFFATHMTNGGETPAGLLAVFVAGIVFSYALWRTGSLWWGIGFHMTWDWAQSFLFGVPDSGALSAGRLFATRPAGSVFLSGGIDGPEGSAFVLLIFGLVFLVLRRRPRVEQPPVEPLSLPFAG